jgi:regulator of sigma E protease
MATFLDLFKEYGVLPFIIIISAIVFIHEFGHYWVARRCGVRIVTFSINFGRPLFSWLDKHGTRWQVGWLPLGGYVKMFGDADPSSARPDESVKEMTEEEKKVSFFHQSVNKRMAIVIAGPVANYLLAIIILTALFIFHGQPFTQPIVTAVVDNGAASRAGLMVNDRVVSVDGETISRFEDIVRIVSLNAGTPISMLVNRNGAEQTIDLTPDVVTEKSFLGEHHLGRIGITSDKVDFKKWSVLVALREATKETWNQSATMLRAMGQIIVGTRASQEIGGIVSIAKLLGNASSQGPWALVWIAAVISINLGLINLFPIPVLDGGHLLFYTFEKILGHPLNEKIQEIGMRIGLAMVVSLMVFALSNDLHLTSRIQALFS